MENFQQFLPWIEFAGFAVMTTVILFLRGKSGASQVSNDIITTYKLRVEQLEANEKVSRDRSHEHTKEIGQLQGALVEKERELERLRTILENRDPELVTTLKSIQGFMEKIDGHMQEHTAFNKNKRGKKK